MAIRITLKRSSIPNKRPNADILDPGELALNTNALTPGLFFEADNNSVIKVGPTAVGPTPPVTVPSLGESYYDQATGNLSIGDLDEEALTNVWKKVSSPYLGGTDGFVTFVAPEFPNSTDSILNDGQSLPFKTLNRAIIEVAKRSIKTGQNDRFENNRYTIVVTPGSNPVYNGPGFSIPREGEIPSPADFNVNFDDPASLIPTVLQLQQFNPQDGGLLLPRGTSIVGMDLRKSILRPTYVPTSKNPTTGEGQYQPRSAVIKWTGNSYLNSLTFRDKTDVVNIVDIESGLANEALFISRRAHGLEFNQKVSFSFTTGATTKPLNKLNKRVRNGTYYALPIGVDTFYLSTVPLVDGAGDYLQRDQLPVAPQGIAIASLTTRGYSHNRLSALYCATFAELNEFYIKVQLAFPSYFQSKENQAEVINPGETEIVAPVRSAVGESLLANSVSNSSAYANNVSVRSQYGMCGIEHNGDLVTGFRSVQAGIFTHISIQNDPIAYEIYTTVQDPSTGKSETNWYTLQYATWAGLPSKVRPSGPNGVTRAQQLALLNQTNLVNIRWWYDTQRAQDGKSFGIPDFNRDFRHFSVRVTGGAFGQIANNWSVGAAVGFWAYSGGRLSVTNSSSNFGSMALRSEGFSGIGNYNSDFEATPPDTGFVFAGIRAPLRLTGVDTLPSRRLSLGCSITSVSLDPSGKYQIITCGTGFQPVNIQPFSLEPNNGIYVLNETIEYRAFLADNGKTPLIVNKDGTLQIWVRAIDSSFPLAESSTNPSLSNWSSPFIKRWRDPRSVTEQSYAIILENTNPNHEPPAEGKVLRLNQNTATSSRYLRPGVQFDPAASGGWGRVLQVAYSQSAVTGDSPQFNEVLLNRPGANNYYVALNLVDNGVPWLERTDQPHGGYTTYDDRNWYAACNDYWKSIYYSSDGIIPAQQTLPPPDFNSPWATTYCTEKQDLVDNTYFGDYFVDPTINNYPEGSQYFRGAQPANINYSFEFGYNKDNGSPSFGLLKYNTPTSYTTTTTEDVTPTETEITVAQVKDIIPNPKNEFVMVALVNGNRTEYCQVIGADIDTKTITVIRGQYGTVQTTDWPTGTVVTLQAPGSLVDPVDYDTRYTLSRRGIFRFLRIMGFSSADLQRFLVPRPPSERNIPLSGISLKLGTGYALLLGSWPLQFSEASQVDASAHSFYATGTITYSRGLPEYNSNIIPTKQYYDLLCAKVWGGAGSATTVDEKGSIPLSGTLTQLETGRPYNSFTSLISDLGAIEEVNNNGEGGGVSAVFTGPGLTGGPIFSTGTISMLAATATSIGGVLVGTGLAATASGVLNLQPATTTNLGGVIIGDGLSITPQGVLSTSGDPGGVSQLLAGNNITLDPPDGKGIVKISSSGGGSDSKVIYVDDISPEFNGSKTTFLLSAGGTALKDAVSTSLLCVLGGVPQYYPVNFAIADGQIIFTTAPPAGASFFGMYFGGSYSPVPPVGGVTLIQTGAGLVGGPITSTGTLSIAQSPAVPGSYKNADITIDSSGRIVAASNGSGGGGGGGVSFFELDRINSQFDGSKKQFTLQVDKKTIPADIPRDNFFIWIEGVCQNPGQIYDIVGSDIVFVSAPPKGTRFNGRYCLPTNPALSFVPVPVNSGSPGNEGDYAADDNYFYLYSGGQWRRTLWTDPSW